MVDFSHFTKPADIKKDLVKLRRRKSSYWEDLAEDKILKLSNYVMRSVPAYKKFLQDNGYKKKSIGNIEEFNQIPLITKDNYLRKYSYEDLFPRETMKNISTISSTSGSTGEPFYFPRIEQNDDQYEYLSELYFLNQFEMENNNTLAINGFGLGIWIGGIFTYKVLNKLSQKNYDLSVAPTGRNKEIFLKTFNKMAKHYDQIILMGYPPFIKDVVDEGIRLGIKWQDYRIRILTATEGFSEKFREYLAVNTGLENKYIDTLNIYGSVEFGTMSHETPISILIRKLASENKRLFVDLFPGARIMPTLVQYYPHIVYFEEVNNEVIASGYGSAIPLLRYRFFDKGGKYSFNEMMTVLNNHGINIYEELERHGISEELLFKLPFVYVYERSDFAVNLRGANIYPGNIKAALEDRKISKSTTGKFTMIVKENSKLNEYLEINIELKRGKNKTKRLEKVIKSVITNKLLEVNSEYANMYNSERRIAIPQVKLQSFEHPKYFSDKQIKQKWVIK